MAAAINLLAARAARVQSRPNLSRSLSPKLDHSHSITPFDRSRTGPKMIHDGGKIARSPRRRPDGEPAHPQAGGLREALRMIPEKIAALADAQMIIATGILSGRPDLAPAEVIALYRGRVSANEQRLTAS